MRVALVFKRWSDSGGSERQVTLLVRELLARGDEVHLFCEQVRGATPAALVVHRLSPLPLGRTLRMLRFSRWAARQIARHERAHGPFDVQQAFGRTVGQQVYRLGGGCHRSYLELAHALDRPRWLRALLARHPYQVLKARLEERALEPAPGRRIIVNSEMTRRDLGFRYGLAPASIHVLRNGVDLARFRPAAGDERGQLRAELGLAADAEVALFLGTGFSRKGLQPTLRAVARLAAERPALVLLVAGRTRRARAWSRLARQLGIDRRVVFLGARSDPERLYRAADVFVLPAAYDPAANATLEALASGLPVVTSQTNGAGEVLEEGVQGTVVPAPVHPQDVADAIAFWLARSDRQAIARAARRTAEHHPADTRVEELLAIWDESRAERAAQRAART